MQLLNLFRLVQVHHKNRGQINSNNIAMILAILYSLYFIVIKYL